MQAFFDLGNLHDFPKCPLPSKNIFRACQEVSNASRYFLLEGGNDKPHCLTMTGFSTQCNSPGRTDSSPFVEELLFTSPKLPPNDHTSGFGGSGFAK